MKTLICVATLLLASAAANAQWPDRGKLNVWTVATVSRTKVYDDAIYLKDVRTGNQKTFDRITFEFTGGIPRYEVRTERTGRFDTTGERVVRVSGRAFLSIAMNPLPYPENTADDIPIPKGNLKLPVLREVKDIEWFEGDRQFGIGLNRRSQFRVLELTNPYRLVIDIKH
jgi:hypothetical protein